MKRREFITASLVTGTAALTSWNEAIGGSGGDKREFYELRKYYMLIGNKKKRLNDFLKDVAIPAWNRIGIGPVGVFNVQFGPNKPTLYVLLPHKNIESVITARDKLAEDKEYQKAGADFLNTSIDDPGYFRIESSLMRAFKNIPELEVPEF